MLQKQTSLLFAHTSVSGPRMRHAHRTGRPDRSKVDKMFLNGVGYRMTGLMLSPRREGARNVSLCKWKGLSQCISAPSIGDIRSLYCMGSSRKCYPGFGRFGLNVANILP
jgi:hypothetical protein